MYVTNRLLQLLFIEFLNGHNESFNTIPPETRSSPCLRIDNTIKSKHAVHTVSKLNINTHTLVNTWIQLHANATQENYDNVNDCFFQRDILFVSVLHTGNMLVDFENTPRSPIRTRWLQLLAF
jgi:hypothetical protein